jgi:dienelactone hydrolase
MKKQLIFLRCGDNMKRLFGILALVSATAHAGLFGSNEFTDKDVDYFQPPIVSSQAPAKPLNMYSVYNNTIRVNLSPFQPIIPTYNNKGNLLASWTPHPSGIKGRPTIVIVHGGHGLVPGDYANAMWARDELGANVLLLDSFWSRGQEENWYTYNRLSANARMLDSIAAGKWLQQQGVDKDKIFLLGGSQGGWTVLRTFTNEPWIAEHAKGIYRAGISLYPVCNSKGWREDPELGPYHSPVIVFTAGKDGATPPDRCPTHVFKDAVQWTHYPDATHGFDVANRGAHSPSVDGECGRAMNTYNKFPVCRSDAATNDMHEKTKQFIRSFQ